MFAENSILRRNFNIYEGLYNITPIRIPYIHFSGSGGMLVAEGEGHTFTSHYTMCRSFRLVW